MLVRELVKKFFEVHEEAFANKAVYEPNMYVKENLAIKKTASAPDDKKIEGAKATKDELPKKDSAKADTEGVKKKVSDDYVVKEYASLMRQVFQDFPAFDASSITTRNAVNIFYQFSLLILKNGNPDPLLRPTLQDLDWAEKKIREAKAAIQAHVVSVQSVSKNPLNILNGLRGIDPEPFKSFFAFVDSSFTKLKEEITVKVEVAAILNEVVEKVSAQPLAVPHAIPSAVASAISPPKAEIAADVKKIEPSVSELQRENEKLKNELKAAKDAAVALAKEVGHEKIKQMANIDKSLIVIKQKFDGALSDALSKLKEKELKLAGEVQAFKSKQKKDDKSLVPGEDKLQGVRESIKQLNAFKIKVTDFEFLYKDFFQRMLFESIGMKLPLPNHGNAIYQLNTAKTLPLTMYYKRMLKDKGLPPEGSPEFYANLFFNKIEELLKFIDPAARCPLKLYHHKLGEFDKVYWESLMDKSVNLDDKAAPSTIGGGMVISNQPLKLYSSGFPGLMTTLRLGERVGEHGKERSTGIAAAKIAATSFHK